MVIFIHFYKDPQIKNTQEIKKILMIPSELYDRQIVPKAVCHEDQSTKQKKRHILGSFLLHLPYLTRVMLFNGTFKNIYIMSVSFIGSGNQSIRRKPAT